MRKQIKLPLEGNGQPMCLCQKPVLTSEEAAHYLSVSMPQLYRLTSNNKIPFYTPTGGKLYFSRNELNEWMLSNRVATAMEIKLTAINFSNNKMTA